MRRWTTPHTTAAATTALALLTAACTGAKPTDSGLACDAPVANAGADQTAGVGAAVQLDASASTVCAKLQGAAVYQWAFESVPPDSALDISALSDNDSPEAVAPSFTPDVPGDYTLRLLVNDSAKESSPDFMVVRVSAGDQAPVADCGPDLAGRIGEALELDGSGSDDPEGATLAYTWTMVEAPACSGLGSDDIFNGAGANPSVVPDCDGIYTVSLVVSDGLQYSEPDICTLNVATNNRPPVADAGESIEFGVCSDNPFRLSGYASYDLDGDELGYLWSVLSAPSGSAVTDAAFDDASTAEPRFTWDVPGTYLFQLQVSDGETWSAPDIVTFAVDGEALNRRPIANAGGDVTVDVQASCESASYVWTCEDCGDVTFDLDGSATFDPDGDRLSFRWTEPTGTIRITNPYGAVTEGWLPGRPSDSSTVYRLDIPVSLEVADCGLQDDDTITVRYSCTGVRR